LASFESLKGNLPLVTFTSCNSSSNTISSICQYNNCSSGGFFSYSQFTNITLVSCQSFNNDISSVSTSYFSYSGGLFGYANSSQVSLQSCSSYFNKLSSKSSCINCSFANESYAFSQNSVYISNGNFHDNTYY
jgi:hypothetical protein